MKCKYIRPMRQINPEFSHSDAQRMGARYQVPFAVEKPAGTIVEDPRAFRLVQQGVAIPEDEECAAAANMTPEQMRQAQAAYERLSKGISTGDPVHDVQTEVTVNDDGE